VGEYIGNVLTLPLFCVSMSAKGRLALDSLEKVKF